MDTRKSALALGLMWGGIFAVLTGCGPSANELSPADAPSGAVLEASADELGLGGCIIYKGRLICPFGVAQMAPQGDAVLVSNFKSGNDGFTATIDPASQWQQVGTFQAKAGGGNRLNFSAYSDTGLLGSLSMTQLDNAGNFALRPSFHDAEGAPAAYTMTIYNRGQVVAQEQEVAPAAFPVLHFKNWADLFTSSPLLWKYYGLDKGQFLMNLAYEGYMPSGRPVQGDQVVFTPHLNPGPVQLLRRVEFTGAVQAYTLTDLQVQ